MSNVPTNYPAQQAWTDFHNFIGVARTNVINNYGRGFHIDLHGHDLSDQALWLGNLLVTGDLANSDATLNTATYINKSSIRRLANEVLIPFSELLRGSNSFGGQCLSAGFLGVPTPAIPTPTNTFFEGGYITGTYGSDSGNPVDNLDTLQIESNANVRDTSSERLAFANALEPILENWMTTYYGLDMHYGPPTRATWSAGAGTWGTAANWTPATVPVRGAHLVFDGPGGAAQNNVSGLSATNSAGITNSLSSLTFSDSAWTLYGNAISLLKGITNRAAATQTISNHLTLRAHQNFFAGAGPLVIRGNITNRGNPFRITGNSDTTLGGVIVGSGNLIKDGNGTLTLEGNSSFSGGVALGSGTIALGSDSTANAGIVLSGPLGTGTLLVNSGSSPGLSASGGARIVHNPVTMNTGNALYFQGTNNLTLAGPLNLGSGLKTFTVSNTALTTVSGVISNSAPLIKAGPGTLVLSGSNTFAGGVTINAGTLLANNTGGSATGPGAVGVNSAATLGGSGIIGGQVSGTGKVSPGNSVGVLTLAGGWNASGATYVWELVVNSTNSPGTNFDQVAFTGGNLTLGGSSKLQIVFTNAATAPSTAIAFWRSPQSWRVLTLSGTATNPGNTTFNSLMNATNAAGAFYTVADASGVLLNFVPALPPPILSGNIAGAGTSNAVLNWTAVSGINYQLQCATNLAETNWQVLVTLTATNSTAWFTDTNEPSPQKFYRVVAMP